MSYNIAIVNFKLPENFEEACSIVNSMTDENISDVEEIYKLFHDEITKGGELVFEMGNAPNTELWAKQIIYTDK